MRSRPAFTPANGSTSEAVAKSDPRRRPPTQFPPVDPVLQDCDTLPQLTLHGLGFLILRIDQRMYVYWRQRAAVDEMVDYESRPHIGYGSGTQSCERHYIK